MRKRRESLFGKSKGISINGDDLAGLHDPGQSLLPISFNQIECILISKHKDIPRFKLVFAVEFVESRTLAQ